MVKLYFIEKHFKVQLRKTTVDRDKAVLVVNDDSDIAYLAKLSLQKHNCDVHEFTNPFDALSYFKTNALKLSAILTDIRMPSMGGLELQHV